MDVEKINVIIAEKEQKLQEHVDYLHKLDDEKNKVTALALEVQGALTALRALVTGE